MTREEFDRYLVQFNARDYNGFLDWYTDDFEMIHAGGSFKSREAVLKFYAFLHRYLRESIIVDRFLSDDASIMMEARVRLECVEDLTPEIVAASDYPGIKPLKAGQVFVIPQFIHYHLVNGKFSRVECRE